VKTIQDLERELEQKRAKLLQDIALAKLLPTTGRTFTWLGDGGYVGNDKQPDKEKSVPLDPWLFYDSFRGAQHVGYRAPDEYPNYGDLASRMRRDYVRAVHDAFAPYLVDINALKGTYATHTRANWDWQAHRDYSDAHIVATGRVVLTVNASVEHSGSASLKFYAAVPDAGTVEVSLDMPESHKLSPRPHGCKRCCDEIRAVDTWQLPPNKAANTWKRGSGDHRKLNCTVEYLYSSLGALLADVWGAS